MFASSSNAADLVAPRSDPTWLALFGTITVLGFVLIRAASFEHIDRLIGERILGLRWHWVIEISGISLVLVSSQWRQIR